MSKDIPDFMRGFDLDNDWGFTPVSSKPSDDKPAIDPKVVEGTNIELSKVKSDVSTIKSMMNEIMQIVNDKETITKEISDEETKARFKDIEKPSVSLEKEFFIRSRSLSLNLPKVRKNKTLFFSTLPDPFID